MARLKEEKRYHMLVDEIKSGLARALVELRKPMSWVADVLGYEKHEIIRALSKVQNLSSRFEPWILEQITEAATRIENSKNALKELETLVVQAESSVPKEDEVDEHAIKLSYTRMYAGKMAEAWYELGQGRQESFFRYQPIVVAKQTALEGIFLLAPEVTKISSLTAGLPYLSIAYDKSIANVCDEDANTAQLPIKRISCYHSLARKKAKDRIAYFEQVSREEARAFCEGYFTRKQYDLNADLHKQIKERLYKEGSALSLHSRLLLPTPARKETV